MRVLHLGKYYPPFKGGIETHLRGLCAGLSPHCELDVVVSHAGPRTSFQYSDGARIYRLGRWGHVLSTPLTPGLIPWLAIHNDYDIVHYHHPNPMAILAYLLARPKGRLVITYHSDIVKQRNLLRFYETALATMLARADAIIASSPNYIDSSELLTRFRAKTVTVPYGIPVQRFLGDDDTRLAAVEIRQRYQWRPLVLAVGRMVYYKGFDVLLRAMCEVDAELLLIGSGPLSGALHELARNLDIAHRVHFIGGVDDLQLVAYYDACDLFVLPSTMRSEAFGIVQLEAMVAGKPVVSTNLASGVPFVNRHGHTGITVTPGDPRELATAIKTLLYNPKERFRMGRAARDRVIHEFNEQKMVESTLDVYRQVLANGRSRHAPAR